KHPALYNMKRIFSIAILFTIIFISFSAKAQQKSYISLYGGLSTPIGGFGSYDYYNNQSGFAQKRITFAVDGAVYFYKNLGLGYTLSFQDQSKLTYNDASILAAGYTASYNSDDATVNAYDRYHSWNLMVGPQYSIPYHKFIFDLRAFGGV